MPRSSTYGDWTYECDISFVDGKPVRYSLDFQRQYPDGWYDEIRFDSHDRRRRSGRFLAPHFHLKVRSPFKADSDRALEEVKAIIDNYLGPIEDVIKEQ